MEESCVNENLSLDAAEKVVFLFVRSEDVFLSEGHSLCGDYRSRD